jgi:c-di-GMP-binding flagellar brake protein YcgR
MKQNERRKYRRAPVNWSAVLWCSSNGAINTRLIDISAGGACIITDTPLMHNEQLALYIIPDNQQVFRANSKVVWLQVDASQDNLPSCEIGVHFSSISGMDHRTFGSAISRVLKEKTRAESASLKHQPPS